MDFSSEYILYNIGTFFHLFDSHLLQNNYVHCFLPDNNQVRIQTVFPNINPLTH